MAWGNAYLAGATSPDEAAAAVTPGWVLGLTPGPFPATALPADDSPTGLTVALGLLRGAGVTRLRLALPAPGDPLGLPGPPTLTAEVAELGAGVLTLDGPPLALLPFPACAPVVWRVAPRADRVADVPSLAEAERTLAEALREATETLAGLDVARPDERAVSALLVAERSAVLAPGHPARAHRVLAQAARLRAVVAVALSGDGGAVTAAEIAARAEALRPLERAARRAVVAAYEAL